MQAPKVKIENGLPTPRTLDEAIEHALMVGPLCEIRERSYCVLKDFLAQKFSVAYLRASRGDDALEIMEALFASLTIRPEQPAENSRDEKG